MKITLKTEEEINAWNAAVERCRKEWAKDMKESGSDATDRESWCGYKSFPIAREAHGMGEILNTPFVVNEMCSAIRPLELSDKLRVLSKGGVWLED